MCDNNSKAKADEISSKKNSPRIICFKKTALILAALVVPGKTLYLKKSIDFSLNLLLSSLI